MKNLILVLTTLLVMVCGTSYSQLPTDTIGYNGINLDLLDSLVIVEINNERVSRGIPPLGVSEKLMESSKEHSDWMIENDKYVHSHSGVAECIAYDNIHPSFSYLSRAKSIVDGWMSSPPHRDIILDKNYIVCGIGLSYYVKNTTMFNYKMKPTLQLSMWD